ncbi:MAG: alanine racemase [Anaerolineae bacterium]
MAVSYDRQRERFTPVPTRPTWLDIDLDAVAENVRTIRRLVGPGVQVMGVIKGNAYGHSLTHVARAAVAGGATMVGVACLSEALTLQDEGVTVPKLILGYTPPWLAEDAVRHYVRLTLFDLETAEALSQAARIAGIPARVHIKIDTGMGRLGVLPEEAVDFVTAVARMEGIEIEGLFTHFSTADEADKSYTRWQLRRFQEVLAALDERGIHVPLIHAANSAALLTVPESRFNMVRLGIAMYGLAPSPETPLPPGIRPALTWKTIIAQVKTLPPGSYVSYGNTYQTRGYERIAVIPVGYADGFRRAPTHWGEVLVHGKRAPIVGRVCMDQTMINVTHIPEARQGDEVVLIGRQGDDEITVDEVAERFGTINYEVVSTILARVPRIA